MKDLKDLMLREPRWNLAVAESMSSGRLQAAIGAVSGASEFFAGGITAYNLDQKVRHLGVDRALAEPVACVSEEVARQMAMGVCRLFGTEFGAATTGFAEASAAMGVSSPFAWWALVRLRGDRAVAVRSGRADAVGLGRVEAQCAVAQEVLRQLVAFVASQREAG